MKTPKRKSLVAGHNKSPKTNTPQGGSPKTKGKKPLNGSQNEKKFQKGTKREHEDKRGEKKTPPKVSSNYRRVELTLPKLQSTKPVFQKILPHCVDIKTRGYNCLILKLSQTKFDDDLAALKGLTFEGKKLRINICSEPVPQEMKPEMSLSKEERVRIILLIGNRSQREVAAEFNRLHPDRDPITQSCVSKLAAKFRETGSVEDKLRSGPSRRATDDDTATAILAQFSRSPKMSLRRMSSETGVSKSSIHRILQAHT